MNVNAGEMNQTRNRVAGVAGDRENSRTAFSSLSGQGGPDSTYAPVRSSLSQSFPHSAALRSGSPPSDDTQHSELLLSATYFSQIYSWTNILYHPAIPALTT